MKRRVRKIANFFAFNLLFFALYLNFIHKDKNITAIDEPAAQQQTAAFGGTVLVDNPDEYSQKKTIQPAAENRQTAMKLSVN
jgi:hypothetical protein